MSARYDRNDVELVFRALESMCAHYPEVDAHFDSMMNRKRVYRKIGTAIVGRLKNHLTEFLDQSKLKGKLSNATVLYAISRYCGPKSKKIFDDEALYLINRVKSKMKKVGAPMKPKKYEVYASFHFGVEAESESEARAIAEEKIHRRIRTCVDAIDVNMVDMEDTNERKKD